MIPSELPVGEILVAEPYGMFVIARLRRDRRKNYVLIERVEEIRRYYEGWPPL